MTASIEQAAAQLLSAQTSGIPCPPVRGLLPEGDLAAAYAVQNINVQRAEGDGRRIIGRKIGLTAKSVQKQLGVDQPDYGILFADMEVQDGEIVAWDRVLQPKAEAEVALVLERDLDRPDTTLTELVAATAYVLPAIEIVGSRIANWDISILDTIADNASSGAYVLGAAPRKLADVDLRLCGMAMFRAGEPVSVGAGAACLGHPLNAALWLARTMAKVGRPLQAGDVVLTGALGPMVAARPGDIIEARIEGLGSVTAAFGREAA
ncbi:2-keto-4-pentenoate hydratase [Sphingobium sp. 22B]|uniref:2-keto-4-pentenoate hydratase n=1 Tax=Sphingobium sp. 22B TaxID=936474 RepID=UPI000780461F|nr:2-keto-4-pentenoate hydratase [Sphingobium sp. 22B]KYC29632.1 2-keto-4-pentenoate hydratase [Sphingobium sp. 22B]